MYEVGTAFYGDASKTRIPTISTFVKTTLILSEIRLREKDNEWLEKNTTNPDSEHVMAVVVSSKARVILQAFVAILV